MGGVGAAGQSASMMGLVPGFLGFPVVCMYRSMYFYA